MLLCMLEYKLNFPFVILTFFIIIKSRLRQVSLTLLIFFIDWKNNKYNKCLLSIVILYMFI